MRVVSSSVLVACILFPFHASGLLSLDSNSDGVSNNAPSKDFYVGLDEGCCGEDPHPVHGVEVENQGFVGVGKNSDSNGSTDGFIFKTKPLSGQFNGDSTLDTNDMDWVVNFGTNGQKDGANFVLANQNGIFVGAYQYSSTDKASVATLFKYNTDGTQQWHLSLPGSVSGKKTSAIASMAFGSDGGVIVTGITDTTQACLEGFKSYGNPSCGKVLIAYVANTEASTPSWTWKKTLSSDVYGISIKQMESGFILLAQPEEGSVAKSTILSLDQNGNQLFRTTYTSIIGTDVLALKGPNSGNYLLLGLGTSSDVDGAFLVIDASGAEIMTKTFGNPIGGTGAFVGLGAGNPKLIYDECWGGQATIDGGAVLGCGTGIEGCDGLSGSLATECSNDPRTKWRSFIVKLNNQGGVDWHRVDSFKGFESASEHIAITEDGGLISVNDQDFGIGLLKLAPFQLSSPTTIPPSLPPVSPEPQAETPPPSTAGPIILVGDSAVEYSLNYLDKYCGTTQPIRNSGVGGTEASQWALPNGDLILDAFAGGQGTYTHAWLSVGGNDFLNTGCSFSSEQKSLLKANVEKSIANIRDNSDPNLQILMTSYYYPSSAEAGCSVPGALDILHEIISDATATDPLVQFVDIRGLFGGSADSFSNGKYFVDPIHLNEMGYQKFFTLPEVQTFFQCNGGTIVSPKPPTPKPTPNNLSSDPPTPKPTLSLSSTLSPSVGGTQSSGFDWGEGCSAGDGYFLQNLPTKRDYTEVGEIPKGKFNIKIQLRSTVDIDITLFDLEDTSEYDEGKAIVAWCSGDCNSGVLGMSSTAAQATYKGMTIEYSGYNGVDGKGNEYIEISGETSTRMLLKAYTFATGTAEVMYEWGESQSDCCRGTGLCFGSFQQSIELGEVVRIGEIPAGKYDIDIQLKSQEDVDIQIYDLTDVSEFAEGKSIVGWCKLPCNKGIMSKSTPESIQYPSFGPRQSFYRYSGYNGVDGKRGEEYIRIDGLSTRSLMMKAYGYKSGLATVEYTYRNPV